MPKSDSTSNPVLNPTVSRRSSGPSPFKKGRRTPPTLPSLDSQGRFIGPRDVERGFRFFRHNHPRMA